MNFDYTAVRDHDSATCPRACYLSGHKGIGQTAAHWSSYAPGSVEEYDALMADGRPWAIVAAEYTLSN